MANGWTDKEMIEMILEGQGKLQEQLSTIVAKVDGIMVKGCAHRAGDLLRVEALEKTKNSTTGGIILALLSAVGALAVAIGGHLGAGK